MESFSSAPSARERAQRQEDEDARRGKERDDAGMASVGRGIRLRLYSGGWERDRFSDTAVTRRVPDVLPRDLGGTLVGSRGLGTSGTSVGRPDPVRRRQLDVTSSSG